MAEDLSKRGKVGDVYRSGSFAKAKKKGLKTSALNKAQLKRAQTVGGKKITARQVKRATNAKNKTSISDTKFVKGQGVIGPNGKPLTGSVTLASGKTAQYVKGRRVVASKKAPVTTRRGGGGGGSGVATPPRGKGTVTRVPPSVRGEGGGGSLSTYQANRLGAESPKYSVARATKPSYGPYESQSDRNKKSARKAAAAAAAKRNQSKPRSNGKAVPMQLRKQKDGSYRWVKVV